MPGEHLSNPESHETNTADLESARAEKLAELKEASAEHDPADHAEKRAEAARETIQKQEVEPEPAPQAEKSTASIKRPMEFLDHHLNYRQTLTSVQRQLTPISRRFSQVIHTPAVEKVSEVMERTVARPSVVAGSVWTAVIVGSIFYLFARQYGYNLRGSELIFSFIIGAVLGLSLEGAWKLIKRR